MSLTNHSEERVAASSGAMERQRSPGPPGSGPRRKQVCHLESILEQLLGQASHAFWSAQARPRRRSGDSIGNASLDLTKPSTAVSVDSPPHHGTHAPSGNGLMSPFRKSPPTNGAMEPSATPENLSLKRPSSSPAINLVKTESLLEEPRPTSADHSPAKVPGTVANAAAAAADGGGEFLHKAASHFAAAAAAAGHHEHESRMEALQVRLTIRALIHTVP